METRVLETKKYLCMRVTTNQFPLGFDARVVYSFLVGLAKFGNGRTEESIIKALEHYSIKVPTALGDLLHEELVTIDKDGYKALEPTGKACGYFAWHKGTYKRWYDAMRYMVVYYPSKSCPLTYREYFLWRTLFALAEEDGMIAGQSRKGLANLTTISRPLIKPSVDKLHEIGLVTLIEDDERMNFDMIGLPHHSWFVDIKAEQSVDRTALRAKFNALKNPQVKESQEVALAHIDESDIIEQERKDHIDDSYHPSKYGPWYPNHMEEIEDENIGDGSRGQLQNGPERGGVSDSAVGGRGVPSDGLPTGITEGISKEARKEYWQNFMKNKPE